MLSLQFRKHYIHKMAFFKLKEVFFKILVFCNALIGSKAFLFKILCQKSRVLCQKSCAFCGFLTIVSLLGTITAFLGRIFTIFAQSSLKRRNDFQITLLCENRHFLAVFAPFLRSFTIHNLVRRTDAFILMFVNTASAFLRIIYTMEMYCDCNIFPVRRGSE